MSLNIQIDPIAGSNITSVTGEVLADPTTSGVTFSGDVDRDNSNGNAWIVPGSVSVYYNAGDTKRRVKDNGDGTLVALVSQAVDGNDYTDDQSDAKGTVNYLTGAVSVTQENTPNKNRFTVTLSAGLTGGNFTLSYGG